MGRGSPPNVLGDTFRRNTALPPAAWLLFWPQPRAFLASSVPEEVAHCCRARAEGSFGLGSGRREGDGVRPRVFSGWPGQGPFLSMRSYLGQRACKAGRPQRPHKAHSARPLFTHLLSPRARATATPAQRLSPSFDVQEQKTAIKCCFKEGVLTALPSVKRKLRPERGGSAGEGRGGL